MLDELQHQRLRVNLPKASHPGERRARVVEEENPEWYRHFCSRWPTYRASALQWKAFKTAISRRSTEKALKRIIEGRLGVRSDYVQNGTAYIGRLVPEIRRYLRRGDQERRDQRAHHLRGVPF
jgi:hypothetical protein